MRIGGFIKSSLIDYPDKIAAVIFTQGCTWRCPYCHNQSLVEPACYGPLLELQPILDYLENRKNLLDAVVITGGEPTLQQDLTGFLCQVKQMGFLVKLDTNGIKPQTLQHIISEGLVDFIAMDLKGPIEDYERFTESNIKKENILRSAWLIRDSELDYEFRTTVVPGLHTPEDLIDVLKWAKGVKRFAFQQYVARRGDKRNKIFREAVYSRTWLKRMAEDHLQDVGHFEVR